MQKAAFVPGPHFCLLSLTMLASDVAPKYLRQVTSGLADNEKPLATPGFNHITITQIAYNTM